MRCDEVKPLQDPYLDSELDAKTTLEIEQHLKSCPDCARRYAEEQTLEARIKAGLNRGDRTAALWEQIEGTVVAAAAAPARPQPSPPAGGRDFFAALGEQLQAAWHRSRWAWSALAATWVVILGLSFAAREPKPALMASQGVPSASQMRLALIEKLQLMAELAVTAEPAPADKAKAAPPSPRSDRRKQTLNT